MSLDKDETPLFFLESAGGRMLPSFRVLKGKKGKKVSYQYGESKPSSDEEEAFANWFSDTFEVKEKVKK